MTTPVRWARPDDEVADAARQLLVWRISALPVVDHGRLVGIIPTPTACGRW